MNYEYLFVAHLCCGVLAFIIFSYIIADYLPKAATPDLVFGSDYAEEDWQEEREIQREIVGKFFRDVSFGFITLIVAIYLLNIFLKIPHRKGE